ncbi:hypothetical protein Moror_3808 [Moniliophthora roreri MCA 2997]|uniref:Uncharacterized protein n=2 Tax=Moniliophthora roreri TaxID=221103 RepID=V2XXX0_MONRO|nr:hypothetical protein Moror_3808 [Moniliophthora roreri MCA 2997]KAI3602618.1 hypothetical protein WG66_009222 [Moniliophthora roreri]
MSFFENSSQPSFLYPHFAAAHRDININYVDLAHSGSSTMELIRRRMDRWPDSVNDYKVIPAGDIKIVKTVGRQELEMRIEDDSPASERRETNPFRVRITQRNNALKAVKVIRSVHTAEIDGRGSEKFTVVNYEVEGDNSNNTYAVCKPEFEFWSRRRHAKLPQLFGVTQSSIPALIYYNARVNAVEVYNRYQMSPIIQTYLNILRTIDAEEVNSIMHGLFGSFTFIPYSYWEFDFSTQSFCYSLEFPVNTHTITQVENSRDSPTHCYTEYVGTFTYLRRPQIHPPALENGTKSAMDVISYVSHIMGDYLDSVVILARQNINVDPLEVALDGLIPFGACFEKPWGDNRGPILASFQSMDLTPEWVFRGWMSTIHLESTSSSSVNSRVRMSFLNWQLGGDFRIAFTFTLPTGVKRHIRRAFLSQSFGFMEKAGIDIGSSYSCHLLDHVDFEIKGQFSPLHISPTAPSVPIHLFIDPLKTEIIDGLPCLRYPPERPFIHWSLDPDGPTTPVDMDNYGLTSLKLEFSAGTWWNIGDYQVVKEYLCSKGYDHYSTAYAVDHGYPLLTYRNPEEGAEPTEEMTEAITAKKSSSTQDDFEVASRTSKLRRTKRIGSRIRRFVDHFARREKVLKM